MNHFENTSDSQLVRKIKSGEKEACRQLFERYAPRIYNFSFFYLKNKADAEGLVQDVFLKIWEKRETLDHSKDIKAFIFKITINIIYDLIRKRNLKNAFTDFSQANYESCSENTWHTVVFDETQAKLFELVTRLPGQQQKIFHLSKTEGLNNQEIAERLNVSKRTVENHLYRAIFFLKEHIKNESFGAMLFFYLCCG